MTISCDPPPMEHKERYISIYERSAKAKNRTQQFECTETIGFESMSLSTAGQFSDEIPMNRSVVKETRRRRREKEILPPVLTILNEGNGRSRFRFRRMRTKDGRMRMEMEEKEERDGVLRCFRGDGRLKMEIVGEEEEFGCVRTVDQTNGDQS